MEKFEESLLNSEKYLLNANHMFNVTLKLVNDKKIMLNVLENMYKSLLYGVDSVLQLEFLLKRVKLFKESEKNFQVFKNLSENYGITIEEIKIIDDIFFIVQRHKGSGVEFLRGQKLVIMANNVFPAYFDTTKIKDYLQVSRNILEKIKKKLASQNFL
jgi:hypothetical protein